MKNENQIEATTGFVILMICSTYFGHFYAHHQGLTIIVLMTRWAVGYVKTHDSVSVKFLFVVYVRC